MDRQHPRLRSQRDADQVLDQELRRNQLRVQQDLRAAGGQDGPGRASGQSPARQRRVPHPKGRNRAGRSQQIVCGGGGIGRCPLLERQHDQRRLDAAPHGAAHGRQRPAPAGPIPRSPRSARGNAVEEQRDRRRPSARTGVAELIRRGRARDEAARCSTSRSSAGAANHQGSSIAVDLAADFVCSCREHSAESRCRPRSGRLGR